MKYEAEIGSKRLFMMLILIIALKFVSSGKIGQI